MPWSGSCQRRSTASTIASSTRHSASAARARAGRRRPRSGPRSGRTRRAGPAGWRRCRRVPVGIRRSRAACRCTASGPRSLPSIVYSGCSRSGWPPVRSTHRSTQRRNASPRPSEPRSTSARARHRGVAQPAVAVVPVAYAAESPRAATSWPRRGSSRSASWHRPRSVSALRSTRSRATAGSVSEADQSRHGASAAAWRSAGAATAGRGRLVPNRSLQDALGRRSGPGR